MSGVKPQHRVRASRSTTAVVFLFLLLGALALSGPSATGAAFPGENGRIAYASNQNGSWDIYSMNADGSGKRQLTNGPGDSTQPSFSADGQRIAFASNRAGNYDIYTMNADGSAVARLTNDPGADTQPTFSPDGSVIAFLGKRGTSWYGHIYLMNADGSNQVRLVGEFGSEERPTFSPDGRTIALGRIEQKHRHIVTMNPAGGELTALTRGAFDDRQPTFSPNGQRIAFSSRRAGHAAIFTMRSDGSAVNKLTGGLPSQMPAYSPDGRQIAFARGGGIYSMNANGGGELRLTKQHGAQAWPTWQPLVGPGAGGGGSSGGLRIGKPILDKRHGTAKLPVTVPAAGTISLRGKGIAPLGGRSVGRPATVKLSVKPKRKLANLLKRHMRAKVKVTVSFTPRSGRRETKAKRFTLRRAQ
jgi:dipeptidyl aminopeptidase/acylaminoacyl peptidase